MYYGSLISVFPEIFTWALFSRDFAVGIGSQKFNSRNFCTRKNLECLHVLWLVQLLFLPSFSSSRPRYLYPRGGLNCIRMNHVWNFCGDLFSRWINFLDLFSRWINFLNFIQLRILDMRIISLILKMGAIAKILLRKNFRNYGIKNIVHSHGNGITCENVHCVVPFYLVLLQVMYLY